MRYSEFRKQASYVDPESGLTIEPAAADKSTRIRQMLRRGNTDISKWVNPEEMPKQAAFDPSVIGSYIKDNYGAWSGGALGLILGAMLGRRLFRKQPGLGGAVGGALGATALGLAGKELQDNGTLQKGYDFFRQQWDNAKGLADKGTHAAAEGIKATGEAVQELPGRIGLK